MNRINPIIAAIVVAGILVVVAFLRMSSGPVQISSGYRLIMGTFGHIVVVAANRKTAQKCIDAALEQLDLVNTLMNDYDPNSQLSNINRQAYDGPIKVSEPIFKVLQRSLEFSRETQGAFDITVGPLVDMLRSAERKGTTPSEEEIAKMKSKVGFEKLKLDDQNGTVKFAVDGMRLDLGGIAKGYAIDKAVEAMQKNGAMGGMVDIGGDIRCFGLPKDKDSWLIGLQDPKKAETGMGGKPLAVLKLTDAAVATSGDYRRFALIEDKKYSHIIDAETGSSSDQLTSVTIIAKNATDADALATAVSVMGLEKGLALIESRPDTEAVLIPAGPRMKLFQTKGVQQYISQINLPDPNVTDPKKTKPAPAPDPKKVHQVSKAVDPPKLSGDWASGAWADVKPLDISQFWGTKPEHMPKTQAKLLYDDQFIYAIFRVEDKYVKATAQKHQDMVCFDSCVEFFFTPGPDISKGYFNLETNCGGTMLFNFQSMRGINLAVVRDTDLKKVEIFHSEPRIIEPEKQQPTTWIIEYRLPLEVLEKYCSIVRPEPGTTWRANFYKCADKTSHPHLLVWTTGNTSRPDFHRPEAFGTLEFK